MVSCDFIDLTDGQWKTMPQNAVNIMIEAHGTFGVVHIETSHSQDLLHDIANLHPGGSGNKDHVVLQPGVNFIMNCVRIQPATLPVFLPGEYIRIYFNRVKL
jgi:hypothetical protein